MEENIPPPLDLDAVTTEEEQDDEAAAACCNAFSPASSDESGVTISQRDDTVSTGWTDEKHNAYLDFLERSFVDQLNHPMMSHSWLSQGAEWGPCTSQQLSAATWNSCNQFKVLRGGCWQMNNFKRNEPEIESTLCSHAWESPGMHHFISARKFSASGPYNIPCQRRTGEIDIAGNSTLFRGLANSSRQHPGEHLCQQDSVGSCSEFSDQNFVETDMGKSDCAPAAKKTKRKMVEALDNDQVVPAGVFHRGDNSFSNSGREPGNHEHQHLQPYMPPTSSMHQFLRGS